MTVPVNTSSKTTLSGNTDAATKYVTAYTVFDASHVDVYKNGTKQTSGFTTTIADSSTHGKVAEVVFASGQATSDVILLIRNVPYKQEIDFINNSVFDIETLERGLDQLTMQAQQLETKTDGTLKFADTLSGSTAFDTDAETAATVTANQAARTNKGLMFDADGNITVTDDNPNEQVTLAEAQVALATTQATNAAGSGTTASEWATKDDGYVSGTGNSSKAWAIGGTYVTDTANRGASKEWAIEDSGTVDGTNYSAKAHASVEGANAPPEGSAKEWATSTTTVADGKKGAKGYADDAATSATNAATSASNAATSYASFTGIYKTGATDPYSSKDSGDLWYDTSASTLKVWSGSAWITVNTLPQDLGTTDTPTFGTPTTAGHAAIKSYVDTQASGNSVAMAIALG